MQSLIHCGRMITKDKASNLVKPFVLFVLLMAMSFRLGLSSQMSLSEPPEQTRRHAHQHDRNPQLPTPKHRMRSLERTACFVESPTEQTQLPLCEFETSLLQLHDPRDLRALCWSQVVVIR